MTIDTSREAVERILEGVTPGPWGCSMGKLVRIVKVVIRSPIVLAGVHRFGRNGGKATDGDCEANGRFIAASRDLVPALLAERDEYRDQIAELLPAANREAVEQRARAEAAEAREQALLTSYDEERKALVESASLRERLKAAEELLQFIAEVAPVADKTCDEPGITFVEACRREMKERGK